MAVSTNQFPYCGTNKDLNIFSCLKTADVTFKFIYNFFYKNLILSQQQTNKKQDLIKYLLYFCCFIPMLGLELLLCDYMNVTAYD